MTARILHIIPSLDRAGAEKQLVLLAERLPRDRFEVHVCAMTRGGPLLDDLTKANIPTTILGKRFKADPVALYRLTRHIRSLQPDLIHTWMFAANTYGRVAARWASSTAKLIASERCVDRWKASWQFAIDRRLIDRTDFLVANTPAVAQFCTRHGMPNERIRMIPNGILPAATERLQRDELLESLGLPHDSLLIGTVGRLWPQKRTKDLIWASELLHLVQPKAHLLIVGDGPLRRQLVRFRSLLEADEHVHFLGHRDDVPDILPHLDLLWHGSGYEGMPNAIMEAMAASVPVIATDIPGNHDLVVPGETGYLAPIGDRAEFVRLTNRLLNDRDERTRLGEAGRRRIETSFSVEQMVHRYVELYEQIL